jgi:hypothetical protein
MNKKIIDELIADFRDVGSNEWMRKAADAIEQLRADVICLKHQNAEFVRHLTMAQDERNAAVAERDEARREVCNILQSHTQLWCKDIAKHRGWDCFKEDGK